jgi:hypothetical protein
MVPASDRDCCSSVSGRSRRRLVYGASMLHTPKPLFIGGGLANVMKNEVGRKKISKNLNPRQPFHVSIFKSDYLFS